MTLQVLGRYGVCRHIYHDIPVTYYYVLRNEPEWFHAVRARTVRSYDRNGTRFETFQITSYSPHIPY